MSFDFSTLVTNRSSNDVAYVRQLVERFVAGTATDADREAWNSVALKGAYNYTDLNRVNAAMSAINDLLQAAGYATTYKPYEVVTSPDSSPTNAWVESDMPTVAQMHDYLTNIQGLRNILTVYDTTPIVPTDMNELTIVKANNIEQILVDIEQLIRWMIAGYVRSSAPSFYSGGSPLPTENADKGHTWATLDTLGLTWEQGDSMTWFQLLYV